MPDKTAAIRTNGLVKTFGAFRALDGLDLEVRHGEVHGFLGPNGAGKSTTIRVLLGLLRADAGSTELLGGDPWRDVVELHRRLAHVPGDVALWPQLSGGEALDLLGSLRGGLDQRRRTELVDRFELDPTKRGRQYSKGNRQKVALVAALASDVELLILDEPTSGLDPLMEAVFRDEIVKRREHGTTILLSSHMMSVEALADRVSFIRSGRVVRTGTMEALRREALVTITGTVAGVPKVLTADDVLRDAYVDARGGLTVRVAPARVNEVLALLLRHDISELTVSPASLEELFMAHWTGGLDDPGGSP